MQAVQSPALAAQVFVERRHVWPQLGASGGCPHEKTQQLLEGFASDFGSACNFEQLLLKFGELVREKRDGFKVQVVLPTAPIDAVPELGLAPANRRVQACEQANQEAGLFHKGLFGQHGEQIVHIKPGLVRVASKQGVGNAQQQTSESLPPIGAEFGAKVTDCVMKELASMLKEHAALLVLPDPHAFVCGFEVQRQPDGLSVSVFMQKRACYIGASGQADVLRHEAERVNIACRAV